MNVIIKEISEYEKKLMFPYGLEKVFRGKYSFGYIFVGEHPVYEMRMIISSEEHISTSVTTIKKNTLILLEDCNIPIMHILDYIFPPNLFTKINPDYMDVEHVELTPELINYMLL